MTLWNGAGHDTPEQRIALLREWIKREEDGGLVRINGVLVRTGASTDALARYRAELDALLAVRP